MAAPLGAVPPTPAVRRRTAGIFFALEPPMAILRIPAVLAEMGASRSKFYADVAAGVMVRPIKLGPRAAGIPSDEVQAIARARIAGRSDDEIRALVRRLEAARQQEAA